MNCRAFHLRSLLWGGLVTLFVSGSIQAGVLVAVDVGDGPVQPGFSQFSVGAEESSGSAVVHSYGGISITIDELNTHLWRARDRGDQGSAGTFTQSDLLRDFMTSRDGATLVIDVAGLIPGSSYDVEIWSFDILTNPSFLSSWTANGTLVQQNYHQRTSAPQSNDDYQFAFSVAADGFGKIEILGIPGDPNDGVRVNALRISGVGAAVPEPSAFTLLSLGSLALFAARRLRRT